MPGPMDTPRSNAKALEPSRSFSFAAVLLLLATMMLSACNTMQGLGRDVEAAGDTLTGTAEETEEEM